MQQFEQRFKAGFTTVMGVRMHAANLVHGACSSSSSFFMAERRDVEFEPRASLIMERVRGLKLVHSSGHKRKAGIRLVSSSGLPCSSVCGTVPSPALRRVQHSRDAAASRRQPASSFMVLTVHSFPLPSYSYSFIPRLYEYCIFLSYQHSECLAFKRHQSPPPHLNFPPSIKMQRLNKTEFSVLKTIQTRIEYMQK
jgi:hypothetical protein